MNSALSLPAAGVGPVNPRRTAVSTALAAVGIVFGDLGTSPLYTYQSIVSSVGGHASVPVAMGLLSLVVWALIITVSLKHCLFVMRADSMAKAVFWPSWLWSPAGAPAVGGARKL